MLKYMKIKNFKSLKNVSLGLAPMNLFFGINGMGKSSIIQSLLLLRQSYFRNGNLEKLYTNGSLASLGTANDVFCQTADEESIRFFIKPYGEESYDLSYRYDSSAIQDDVLLRVPDARNGKETFKSALFSSSSFFYLSAEHLGPRKVYDMENAKNDHCSRFGITGEYIVPFLAEQGETFRVPEGLRNTQGRTDFLIDQVSAWMSEISPGVRIGAESIPLTEKAKLNISYQGKVLLSDPHLPVNVGFGIPYVLPLVVELLVSGKDSLVLLENPESHLHPRGQTVIARLMALAASQGAQIICESHSDHIINSMRVSVKEQRLDATDLSISYFSMNEDKETQIDTIEVDHKGELGSYPVGLLDEWGIQLSKLL